MPAPFQVKDLLAASQATFEGLAKARGVNLIFQPLPSELLQSHFMGDLRRLQQALNNGAHHRQLLLATQCSVALCTGELT